MFNRKPKILRSNFLLEYYTNPIIKKTFQNLSKSDSNDKIFKFFKEKNIPKYNLKNCIMEKESKEEGTNVEYYFSLKEELTPKEISE